EAEGLHQTLHDVGPITGLDVRIDGPRFGDLLRADPYDGAPPVDSDTALLIYTSGTTGKSKGVELSFGAVAANVGAVTGLWRFVPEDRLILALPLFHVHGLCLGIHGMLLSGLTTLLFERFDAARVALAFEKDAATVFMGVPTMYVKLLDYLVNHPESAAALSRARLFTSGSAPLPANDFHLFEEKTGHRILERYGMSETLFTLSNPYDGERRPGTVGVPVPGCEVRLVDDDGRDVSSGELGEIVVKSNGMMSGYWGRRDDTAASFRDGWFSTGDVASRSKDGTVTIVGRKSVDVIKSGGYKISAREIEDVLSRHPLVKEVAVVGGPDRLFGQKVVAAVVVHPNAGATLDPDVLLDELSRFAARFLADYKRPRAVIILSELPRNALGKVQKHRLVSA
ncbi:MAG TPA: AMP-binding protein, partial [Thermoanaerobaculia bacterium]|nr:AMP-binding protein [Thermoanaerobaculia bacterium]